MTKADIQHALCGVPAVRRIAGGVFPAEMERHERDEIHIPGHRRHLDRLRRHPRSGPGPEAKAGPGGLTAFAAAIGIQAQYSRMACRKASHFLSPQQPQRHAVDHAGGGAEYDHRPRDEEHLRRHACDQALCLCQDRTHNFFAFLEFYDSVQL